MDRLEILRQAALNDLTCFEEWKDSLSCDEIYNILLRRDANGSSLLHYAILFGFTKMVRMLRQCIRNEQWCSLLQVTDNNDLSPLYLAVEKNMPDMVTLLQNSIPPDQLKVLIEGHNVKANVSKRLPTLELVSEPNNHGQQYLVLTMDDVTILCNAVEKGDVAIVRGVRNSMSAEQWYKLLASSNILTKAVNGDQRKIVAEIFNNVTDSEWYQLLEQENIVMNTVLQGTPQMLRLIHCCRWFELLNLTNKSTGQTALHCAAYNGLADMVREIRKSLMPVQWYEILATTDLDKHTALHSAAYRGHFDIVYEICSSLTSDQLYRLLLTVDGKQQTMLHLLTNSDTSDHSNMTVKIKRFLSTDQWTNLLTLKDRQHRSPLRQVLVQSCDSGNRLLRMLDKMTGYSLFSALMDCPVLHCLVQHDEVEAISSVLQRLNCEQREAFLCQKDQRDRTPCQLASSKAMKELLGEFYFLPNPPQVLIMYTTKERPGAQEECDKLCEVLNKLQVVLTIKKDPTAQMMLQEIRAVQDNHCHLSAIIVIIMSHGQKGAVIAADRPLNINQILLTMNSPRLQDKPKVFLIQACQSTPQPIAVGCSSKCDSIQEDQSEVGVIKKHDANSSNVTETHFDVGHADNLVLMATVNGSKAERNVMIPLFAKNLIMASENLKDLHEIFLKTNRDIISLKSGQVAELRSTLRYKLGLCDTMPPL